MIRKKVKHIYFKSFIDNADIINTHNYFTSYSEFFIDNCTQIGKCTVHFEECLDYIITENNKKEIHIMCSSLRLDSVVAQLSHCSRSEALKKIHAGFVKVNDVVLEQNLQLCNNDFVSIRKTGRFQFKEVVSTTKKGRLVLNFDQYI